VRGEEGRRGEQRRGEKRSSCKHTNNIILNLLTSMKLVFARSSSLIYGLFLARCRESV
jgi:hypothetical protein